MKAYVTRIGEKTYVEPYDSADVLCYKWQVPVSSEYPEIAHYFLHTNRHVLTKALCGYRVNPAFAENGDGAKRCRHCERKFDERGC